MLLNRTREAKEKTAPRRQRRTGGQPVPAPRVKADGAKPMDFVYVIKAETRSTDTGHPVVIPAELAINECYRDKSKAMVMLLKLMVERAAYEVARTPYKPSPATLNVIPINDDVESSEVLTADGRIVRFFIDRMPIV